MGWKASARGVGFYMVKRCGGEVRGKYYLGFRVLVWPLEVQNVPARGVGQNGEKGQLGAKAHRSGPVPH